MDAHPTEKVGPPNKDLLDLGDGGLDELNMSAPLANSASIVKQNI